MEKGSESENSNSAQTARTKTAYERSVERLEARLAEASVALPADLAKNPDEILRKVIGLQKHLEERFASKQNGLRAAYLNAKGAIVLRASRYSNGIDATLYQTDVPQLIVNQRALTNLLVKAVKKARGEMQSSYEVLEGRRQEDASNLEKDLKKYSCLERKLNGIAAAEETLKRDETEVTGAQGTYAQTLLQEGNLMLDNAAAMGGLESLEDAIRYRNENIERLQFEQLAVLHCVQKHDRATASLKQLGEQQAIAYTVLSAFAEGEGGIEKANQAMGVLSESIVTCQQLVRTAYERVITSGAQTDAKRQPIEAATASAKDMSRGLRASMKPVTMDNHKYVRLLRENSIEDFRRLRAEEKERYNQAS